MPDTDLPPFWDAMAFLVTIIISVAMIWYLSISLLRCNTCMLTPTGIIMVLAFGAIIVLSSFKLILMLFPERKEFCPACRLMSKIVEIDVHIR